MTLRAQSLYTHTPQITPPKEICIHTVYVYFLGDLHFGESPNPYASYRLIFATYRKKAHKIY